MDPKAHRRFLDYIDKFVYFGGSDLPKLTRDQWEKLSAERGPLEVKARADELDADELRRLRAIRRLLLVD